MENKKPKIRLTYQVVGSVTNNYAFPKWIMAIPSLDDPTTIKHCDEWLKAKKTDIEGFITSKACYINIGIRRG
jgi:hypothetical protein